MYIHELYHVYMLYSNNLEGVCIACIYSHTIYTSILCVYNASSAYVYCAHAYVYIEHKSDATEPFIATFYYKLSDIKRKHVSTYL